MLPEIRGFERELAADEDPAPGVVPEGSESEGPPTE
jgi:hypothetical protein